VRNQFAIAGCVCHRAIHLNVVDFPVVNQQKEEFGLDLFEELDFLSIALKLIRNNKFFRIAKCLCENIQRFVGGVLQN